MKILFMYNLIPNFKNTYNVFNLNIMLNVIPATDLELLNLTTSKD